MAETARHTRMMRRLGRREGLISLVIPAIFYGSSAFAIWYAMWPYFYYVKNENFIVLGLFAFWRYGWMLTNYIRAFLYTYLRYPWLKKRLLDVPEEQRYPRQLFFIIPSYKEEAWVTLEAFQSIFSNLTELENTRATLVVATGSDEDDQAVAAAYNAHPVRHKVELVLQRQKQGKRIAMGHALRAVARRYDGEENSVCIFMDGDSYLPPETLKNTLPFFTRFRDLGAATTNEAAFINTRSIWYKEWFNLKFGQRHILFKSHALSNKVLTLTGRFSLFRTAIVTSESFIRQIENDTITHWMHGKFRFLMGDDKSSWFYLLKNGWNMLYLHDVAVYSLESRDGSFLKISRSLPYRWYGNTLRNNARALKVGWRKTGLFIWLAILDQRLTMWTSLVGITGATLLALFKSFIYLPFYIAWVLIVRTIQMSLIAWRGHPVSMLTIPLMLYNQWVGAIIKIKASFHLADQNWSKGGATQGGDQNHRPIPVRWAAWMPQWSLFMAYVLFLYAMLLSQHVLDFPQWPHARAAEAPLTLDARQFGIHPDDGQDDARPLNRLLGYYKDLGPLTIQLPAGTLQLNEPIRIAGNRITLAGHPGEGTRLVAGFGGTGNSMIEARGHLDAHRYPVDGPVQARKHVLRMQTRPPWKAGDWLLLSAANTEDFLDQLGSQVWRKPYPRLRQRMLKIQAVNGRNIVFEQAIGLDLPAGMAELQQIQPVEGLYLKNLQLIYQPDNAQQPPPPQTYENLKPNHRVDGIQLHWVTDCKLRNVRVLQAGRHPVNLDGVSRCQLRDMQLKGSWNKGKGGNGYLRIARSHDNLLQHLRLKNLRHLALQWSSSFNQLQDVNTESVDINFHGGFSHHNQLDRIRLILPESHPWPPVFRTDGQARWAPPDGPENRVSHCQWKRPAENSWKPCS